MSVDVNFILENSRQPAPLVNLIVIPCHCQATICLLLRVPAEPDSAGFVHLPLHIHTACLVRASCKRWTPDRVMVLWLISSRSIPFLCHNSWPAQSSGILASAHTHIHTHTFNASSSCPTYSATITWIKHSMCSALKMLCGDNESNCHHKVADTKLAGWRRGLDRLAALVPSLNITFPVLSWKHTPNRTSIMKWNPILVACPVS